LIISFRPSTRFKYKLVLSLQTRLKTVSFQQKHNVHKMDFKMFLYLGKPAGNYRQRKSFHSGGFLCRNRLGDKNLLTGIGILNTA
jgi:hypothetical protein